MRSPSDGLQQIQIAGRGYPARSSRQCAAVLRIDGTASTLLDDGGAVIATAERRELSIEPPLGQAPRRIAFPDGALFETRDHTSVAAIDTESFGSALHRSEAFRPRLILVVLAAILGIVAIWRFALPALIWLGVALTPQPLRMAMDTGMMQALDLSFAVETEVPVGRTDEIQEIFETLIAELPADERDRREFRLLFRDMPGLGPNAMALPGGTVVVTDDLVNLSDGPDMIAGILGHEIGHVTDDHGLRQLYRSLGIYVLVALIAGDTGPVLEDILLEGGVILSLSFSRAQEREADAFGLRLADAAGYDPAGLLEFFEEIKDIAGEETHWTSTHPGTAERIEAIRNYIDAQ